MYYFLSMAHSQDKTDKNRCVHIYISWTRWNGDGFTCYLRPWTLLRTDKTRCHFCSGQAQWLGLLTGIGAIVSWQMHTAKDSWSRLKAVSRALRLGSLLFFCVLGFFFRFGIDRYVYGSVSLTCDNQRSRVVSLNFMVFISRRHSFRWPTRAEYRSEHLYDPSVKLWTQTQTDRQTDTYMRACK